jgi:thiamine biosynthesis lipoprotein
MPCDNNLDSVTIITKKSIDADALSTSFFLMGEKEIEKYIDNHDNIEVRLIDKDGKIKTLGGVHESNR